MQLEHRFTVPASVDVAWETLNDLEQVGSCFPGATVTSVEGDEFSGTCKIKLGPISMQYSGSGKFVERDDDAHRAVIEAKGKDKRGNGTAGVTVTAWLTEAGKDQTDVAVDTDLQITGKPAQFGRGVIQDVSDKLLVQFVQCLEQKIGAADEEGAAAESAPAAVPESGTSAAKPAAAAAESGAGAEAGAEATTKPPGTEPPGPVAAPPPTGTGTAAAGTAAAGTAAAGTAAAQSSHRAATSSDTALDLGATVLPVLAKRYAPYAVGALAVLLILWRIIRR